MPKQLNLDIATRVDITCRKGDSFRMEIDFEEAQTLTGWKMEVRTHDTDDTTATPGPFLDAFTFALQDNADGVVDAVLVVTKAASAMDVTSGLYVYDIQQADTTVKTYLYGVFKINEDITLT